MQKLMIHYRITPCPSHSLPQWYVMGPLHRNLILYLAYLFQNRNTRIHTALPTLSPLVSHLLSIAPVSLNAASLLVLKEVSHLVSHVVLPSISFDNQDSYSSTPSYLDTAPENIQDLPQPTSSVPHTSSFSDTYPFHRSSACHLHDYQVCKNDHNRHTASVLPLLSFP